VRAGLGPARELGLGWGPVREQERVLASALELGPGPVLELEPGLVQERHRHQSGRLKSPPRR